MNNTSHRANIMPHKFKTGETYRADSSHFRQGHHRHSRKCMATITLKGVPKAVTVTIRHAGIQLQLLGKWAQEAYTDRHQNSIR